MANIISKFFWNCAGGDSSILESEKCQTDRIKYFGIGALILFVGILAGLAAGYAFFVVFDSSSLDDDSNSLWWATLFGIFWGLMIFNLDRFLVSTLKKEPPQSSLWNKTKSITVTAVPRLLLAILLAFVISKPLEMRIFKNEVEAKLPTLRNEKAALNREESVVANQKNIDKLVEEITAIEKKMEPICKDAEQRRKRVDDEEAGKLGRKAGRGDFFDIYKKEAEDAEKRCNDEKAKTPLEEKQKELKSAIASQGSNSSDSDKAVQGLDGLATRLEALSRVSGENLIVGTTGWLIFAIILLFEISPVLSKILAPYGTYDKMLEHLEKKTDLYIKSEEIKDEERLERQETLKKERVALLLQMQKDLLTSNKNNNSNIAIAELNNYKRELFRQSIAEIQSTSITAKKNDVY